VVAGTKMFRYRQSSLTEYDGASPSPGCQQAALETHIEKITIKRLALFLPMLLFPYILMHQVYKIFRSVDLNHI